MLAGITMDTMLAGITITGTAFISRSSPSNRGAPEPGAQRAHRAGLSPEKGRGHPGVDRDVQPCGV